MARGTIAYIDTNALQHNLNFCRRLAGSAKILAMIKSNAYGHGLIRVAKALSTADAFGVACLTEALALRQEGISQSIIVMSGFVSAEELPQFVKFQLSPVIHRWDQITALEKFSSQQAFPIWIKIDTGMHRLGFMPDEIPKVLERINRLSFIKKPIGVMTHLADADNFNQEFTKKQLQCFRQITQNLSVDKSVLNSAGLLSYPEYSFDWVRLGIMLYGSTPFITQTGQATGLQPVMTLTAKLMAIKQILPGDLVGYGCTWRADEAMPIGIVGIGYGDGYPRHARNGTPTLLHGMICPLIGRVSMDMIAIDLRKVPAAKIGDMVTLWGEGLPVETVALHADTISYELLTQVTARVGFVVR